MVNQAEEPLLKVTLNLFKADVDYLKDYFGSGYTEYIRNIVRSHCKTLDQLVRNEKATW